jgi:hypothetical protein
MNFREWMDFGRSAFLFKRILKGFFPTGTLKEEKHESGAKTLDFRVLFNNRNINFSLVEAAEPWVGIDFEWEETPRGAASGHAPKLQSGTVDLAHIMREVVASFAKVGLGVQYYPLGGELDRQDSARDRIYDRMLTRSGFKKLNRPGDSIMNYYKPSKVA